MDLFLCCVFVCVCVRVRAAVFWRTLPKLYKKRWIIFHWCYDILHLSFSLPVLYRYILFHPTNVAQECHSRDSLSVPFSLSLSPPPSLSLTPSPPHPLYLSRYFPDNVWVALIITTYAVDWALKANYLSTYLVSLARTLTQRMKMMTTMTILNPSIYSCLPPPPPTVWMSWNFPLCEKGGKSETCTLWVLPTGFWESWKMTTKKQSHTKEEDWKQRLSSHCSRPNLNYLFLRDTFTNLI